MIALVAAVVVAYLAGSVVGSLVVGRFRGVDIREQGSGNPGGTNALRTQGKAFAAAVMVIDVGKGMLAASVVPALAMRHGAAVSFDTVALACGAAAIVGHVWPVFHGFRGGKGAATLIGVLAVYSPAALGLVLVTFALVLTLSGFVGLATMTATASLIAWAALLDPAGLASPFGAFAVTMTVFLVFTHRTNIRRMRAGTEHRFERVMVLRPRR